MDDKKKTKKQLIEELIILRKEISEIKNSPKRSKANGKLIQLAPEIVEKAFHSIWACRDSSKNYEIIFWNSGAEKIYNTPREVAIGLNFVDNFVNEIEKLTSAAQIDEIIHEGRVFKNFLAVDHTPDGENRLVLLDNFRIWDDSDKEYVQVEMALHTTETELLESSDNLKAIRQVELERIRELEIEKELLEKVNTLVAEKQELATIKNISNDFIHNVNNLAGPIKTWVSLIRDRLFLSDSRDEQINLFLEKIERETNRLLDEADQLLHTQNAEKRPVDLKMLIKPMESNIKIQYPEIELKLQAPDEPLIVNAIPSQLSVAVWNIIFNAVEAITESGTGGLIIINLNNKKEGNRDLVEIVIVDDGPGISVEDQSKIFDLGYSTKGKEGLSGYGLWRSKDIVDLLGGKISYASDSVQGTTFTILLPAIK